MYFILIYIYTKPCDFLATGVGKWSVPQLEVIRNSRIPSFIWNKFQNHLDFWCLFRVFTPVPDALSPVPCPHNPFHSLTSSQGCWVCCTSLLSCSSRSSIAPQPSRRRLQLQRSTRLTSKEQANKLETAFLSGSWHGNDRASSTPTGKLRRKQVQGDFSPQGLKRNYFLR